jgi:hypothetical protein
MSDSILAHFDGERILLDEPFELEPNAKLIIQVLPKNDDEREQWLTLSKSRFAGAFANGDDDYPLDLIKETNPEYEAR